MPHILLTGAGFSRNWGSWLADEAFEYLLGHPRIDDGIRTVLWRFKDKGGFEAALEDQRTQAVRFPSPATIDPMQRLEDAIRGMFADIDKAFAEIDDFNFGVTSHDSITGLLTRFDAIFTLNQDLLLERHYLVDTMSKLLHPRDWQIPGMKPIAEPAGTPINEVKTWRPKADPSKFSVEKSVQPYFKLHGSSNWFDNINGQPMLVVGANKPYAIAEHRILMWNFQQFREYLSKPETRLMVIGYSFRDDHINNAIGTAVDGGSLKLFIVDPDGVDVLDKDYRKNLFWESADARGPLLIRFQNHLTGASRRTLREIFGRDPVEHGKVMRFFD